MDIPTIVQDTDVSKGSQRLSWTLVRTPLRRYSADEYARKSMGEVSNGYVPTDSISKNMAVDRTDSRRSMDDRDLYSSPDTKDEIRLNPWTTYRRAPKSLHFTELEDYKPPPENLKPRPKLGLSIISNFKPVGQLVTLRRVSPLPEDDYQPTNQNKAEHENTAFEHDVPTATESAPEVRKIVTESESAPVACTAVTESGEADKCPPGKNRKKKQGKPLDNQKETKSSAVATKELISKIEKEVTQNAMKLQTGVHNCGTRQKKKSQTEQKEEKVQDSVQDTKPQSNESAGKPALKSYFYCRIVTKYPKSSFLLTFAGHMLIAMTTVGLLLSGYDLFPTDFETLPMSDWNVPWKKRDLAWRYRDDYDNRYVRKWFIQEQHKWYRSMDYGRANMVLYYDAGSGNIFEKENLLQMKELEDRIFNIPEYRNYCVQTTAMQCQKPTSVLRLFDGTFSLLDSRFFDPGFNNIAEVLHTANTNRYTRSKFAFFLSKGAIMTPSLAYSHVTRTVIPMGHPLQVGEHGEKMETKMERFLVKHFKPVIEEIKHKPSHFKLIYWSYLLFRYDIVIQIMYDALFAVGSVMFIFGFIVYHTKSLWISTLAVFSILTSFLATNILYRVLFGYQYFGFFHVIAFFIILGIGADDLFVFLDVWKSTGFNDYHSLAHRLSDAYRKSVLSMFFTSLTTAVAFFANALSPLLAPQSFGIFAGLLVIVNYISVIVYFPTVVVIYHIYFKSWKWPCCSFLHHKYLVIFKKNPKEKPGIPQTNGEVVTEQSNEQTLFHDNTSRSSTGHLYNVVGKLNSGFTVDKDAEYGFCNMTRNNSESASIAPLKNNEVLPRLSSSSSKTSIVLSAINNFDDETPETRDSVTKSPDEQPVYINTCTVENEKGSPLLTKEKKKKALVIFFRDYYYKFVTHYLIRWIIVIILTAIVVFFAYCITKLETENEQVQLYRKSHNYGRALDLDFHYFIANEADRNVKVHIVWGLKPRDMSVCHFSDGRCEGREQYDDDFDPNTPEAQMAMKRFCDRLQSFTADEIEYFSIRRNFVSNIPEIRCFTDDLDGFLEEQSDVAGLNLSLPWDYKKTIEFMQSKTSLYNTEKLDNTYTDVLQVPISYWLNDGYEYRDKSVFNNYHSLIGESISQYSTPLKSDMSVFVGNKIRYIAAEVNLTLGTFTSGYPLGKPAMDRWENFVQTQMKEMPKGLRNGFQLTRNYWHSISVQKTMADNAILGIVTGILFAFPILTVATQNVIIAFFAIVCMCCSTVCVIGVIPLAGWKLGILESLNMCMVVGLTVDYVVHLAEGYHLSKHTDRKSRVRDMLELMGISVFSGACTSLGASLFMVFAQIQFIIRFGIFMFCTIGFSLLYSLGLFTTLMGILGPNGHTGDVKHLYKSVKDICCRKTCKE